MDANDTVIDAYRIDAVVGEGAMGTVYRARHHASNHPVAVKILHPRNRTQTVQRLRFEREAELAGRFHHPNLVSVLDTGTTADNHRYIVMELVDGPDLATIAAHEAPMPTARAVRIIKQLCDGLQHAHDLGIVHRDLKPHNILVGRAADGTDLVRIIDFGIALHLGPTARRSRRLTPAAHAMGSPVCLAPETAIGRPIDHRVDLFALGVIAYQLACGVMPFVGTGYEVLCANISQPTPPMRARAPGVLVDPLLEAFARRLMAKRPESRFTSAHHAGECVDLIVRDPAAAAAILEQPSGLARGTLKMPKLERPGNSDS